MSKEVAENSWWAQRPQGLKPALILEALRGAEAPLFHGAEAPLFHDAEAPLFPGATRIRGFFRSF
jgi:hypothetical protein